MEATSKATLRLVPWAERRPYQVHDIRRQFASDYLLPIHRHLLLSSTQDLVGGRRLDFRASHLLN